MGNCSKLDGDGGGDNGVYVKFIFLYFVSDCLFVQKIYSYELAFFHIYENKLLGFWLDLCTVSLFFQAITNK